MFKRIVVSAAVISCLALFSAANLVPALKLKRSVSNPESGRFWI